jgi:hypothetical protein
MNNNTETSTCPTWCTDHFADDRFAIEDSFHRARLPLPAGCSGDVSISLGLLPGELPTLVWEAEVDVDATNSESARSFAAALLVAADKFDEINAGMNS